MTMAALAGKTGGGAAGISGGRAADGGREASLSGVWSGGAATEGGAVETTEDSDAGMSLEMILGGDPRIGRSAPLGCACAGRASVGGGAEGAGLGASPEIPFASRETGFSSDARFCNGAGVACVGGDVRDSVRAEPDGGCTGEAAGSRHGGGGWWSRPFSDAGAGPGADAGPRADDRAGAGADGAAAVFPADGGETPGGTVREELPT